MFVLIRSGIIASSFSPSIDISAATYDNVSFDFTPQGTGIFAVAFSSDGLKMFVIADGFFPNSGNMDIMQYTLSTAWDVSTATYDNVSFVLGLEDDTYLDVAFKNDGSKMYVLGLTSDRIYQYSLATNFDISTASYDGVSVLGPQSFNVGFDLANGGVRLIWCVFGSAGQPDQIEQYSLSTAFDLSTSTNDNTSLVLPGIAYDAVFSNDGLALLVFIKSENTVRQYDLTNPYDISTAVYANKLLDVSLQDEDAYSISLSADNAKMYIAGQGSNSVHQYTL